MALYKRGGGIWWYEFVYNGQRYRESTATTVRSLAEKIERKRHRALEAGDVESDKPRMILFSVAAKDWLDLKEPQVAEKTHTMYTADVARLMPHFGKLLVTDIKDRDLADYITLRRQCGAADKSIRNELGTLRGILKKHKWWEAIKDNIRLPKGREDIGQAISPDEEERLLKACAASRSRSLLVVVMLALNTGMRHDEMRLLRWHQVDFTNEAIKVGKSKTEHGAGRSVPLNQRALATLKEWARQCPERRPKHFVFASEKVGLSGNEEIPVTYDVDSTRPILSWKTSWTTARTAANVSCRFHDLRHSTVTRLLEKGAAIATVGAVMGWSPGTAMRMAKRYGHIGQSAQRDALALLDPAPTIRDAEATTPSTSTLVSTHQTLQ